MFIIYILSLIPVVIWSLMEPIGLRFLDISSITTSLGQILGLIGMVLFSINLILAGRFKFLDKYFKGLDKVYDQHSKIGQIAFSLLLFHPLFLVIKYITFSLKEASLFFVPFYNMPITWGIISLFLMIVLLGVTLYFKLKYNIWKLSHKFMTVAFFFAVLHTLFISSDVSRSNLLRYYILSLAIIGLVLSVRKAFLDKFLVKKFKYKINKLNQLNNDILEIEMEAVDKKIIFRPGQFAFFSFIGEEIIPESHPFSISSSNLNDNLKITVKNLGDFTGELSKLKCGEVVLIDGPYGNFSYKEFRNKNQIWVAGGIGITPFISMAQGLESEYNIDLYYSVKNKDEAVYSKTLAGLSEKNANFKYNLWDTKDKGYINSGLIANMSNGLEGKEIFICGPLSFMKSLKSQFLSLGVDINKIHYEKFNF